MATARPLAQALNGAEVRSRGASAADKALDNRLMAEIQAGNPDALGQLYTRYSARAHKIACSITHSTQDAEDAIHEAFVCIWKGRDQYRMQDTVAPWVLTIVRHRAIDLVRRRSKQLRCDQNPTPTVDRDHAAEAAQNRDQQRAMRARLESISDEQREIIVLAFFGELTQTEIANHLNIPLGTVKGRMRLGLTKLAAQA